MGPCFTVTAAPPLGNTCHRPNLLTAASGVLGQVTVNSNTHPVLYVAGQGGVYRSLDQGTTWTYFPDQSTDGAAHNGGDQPTAQVRTPQ